MRLLAHRALVPSVSPLAHAMRGPDVLRLLVLLIGSCALSVPLVPLLWSRTPLPASLGVSLRCWLRLLVAGVELIANAAVLHARADDMREPVVVALNFERVGDDRLHPVVVARDLYLLDDSESRVSCRRRASFREDLVVVARDDKLRDCVPRPDFDFAVVPTKDDTLTGLHQGHAHAVVGDVYRVIDSTSGRICMLVASMLPASRPALVRLRELHAPVHCLSWLLPKCIPKLLLEIY